jgi:hypothetical protein
MMKKTILIIFFVFLFSSISFALEWKYSMIGATENYTFVKFVRKNTDKEVTVAFKYLTLLHPDNRKLLIERYAEDLEREFQKSMFFDILSP